MNREDDYTQPYWRCRSGNGDNDVFLKGLHLAEPSGHDIRLDLWLRAGPKHAWIQVQDGPTRGHYRSIELHRVHVQMRRSEYWFDAGLDALLERYGRNDPDPRIQHWGAWLLLLALAGGGPE